MGASDEPDIMTWFPRREDYEDAPVAVMPDETIEEKVDRRVVSTDDNTALVGDWKHIYLCDSDSYHMSSSGDVVILFDSNFPILPLKVERDDQCRPDLHQGGCRRQRPHPRA